MGNCYDSHTLENQGKADGAGVSEVRKVSNK